MKLDLVNAFGCFLGTPLNELRGSINFLEDSDTNRLLLVYPVGRRVGVKDLTSNEMKIISQNEPVQEVTSMSLAHNKKFLAICEKYKDDKCAYISFYDMKSALLRNIKTRINVCEGENPTNQKWITSI